MMTKTSLVLVLLCFVVSTSATYTDDIARNVMMPMSGAAYSDTAQSCVKNVFKQGSLVKQVTASCDYDKNDMCSGFIAMDKETKVIVIAFRGSQGFFQLVQEGTSEIFGKPTAFLGGGVSGYFMNAFKVIWNSGLRDSFLTVKNAYPHYKIFITGHSLGGSMASLAAATIVSEGYSPASNLLLVTFGEPRDGNKEYVASFDKLNIEAYRVTHKHDMVVHLPPENIFGYIHKKTEVFYNNDMTKPQYKVCAGDDSDKCSDGEPFDFSINDHLHYFDRDVSGYGESGCISN